MVDEEKYKEAMKNAVAAISDLYEVAVNARMQVDMFEEFIKQKDLVGEMAEWHAERKLTHVLPTEKRVRD